jgi:hypothetical protein
MELTEDERLSAFWKQEPSDYWIKVAVWGGAITTVLFLLSMIPVVVVACPGESDPQTPSCINGFLIVIVCGVIGIVLFALVGLAARRTRTGFGCLPPPTREEIDSVIRQNNDITPTEA